MAHEVTWNPETLTRESYLEQRRQKDAQTIARNVQAAEKAKLDKFFENYNKNPSANHTEK